MLFFFGAWPWFPPRCRRGGTVQRERCLSADMQFGHSRAVSTTATDQQTKYPNTAPVGHLSLTHSHTHTHTHGKLRKVLTGTPHRQWRIAKKKTPANRKFPRKLRHQATVHEAEVRPTHANCCSLAVGSSLPVTKSSQPAAAGVSVSPAETGLVLSASMTVLWQRWPALHAHAKILTPNLRDMVPDIRSGLAEWRTVWAQSLRAVI